MQTGNFRLIANNKKIIQNPDSVGTEPDTFDLTALTADQLILSQTFDEETIAITFGK